LMEVCIGRELLESIGEYRGWRRSGHLGSGMGECRVRRAILAEMSKLISW
jgi:hypothetical protein